MAYDYYNLGDDFATPEDLINSEYSGYNFSGTPATDYYGLGNDFATPADLINSDYLGYDFSGTANPALNFTPDPKDYTYATPKALTDSRYTGIFSGFGPTGSYAPASTDSKPLPISGGSSGGSGGGSSGSGSIINKAVDAVKQLIGGKPNSGGTQTSTGGITDLALALAKLYGTFNPSFTDPKSTSGYQGGVPKLTAMRQQINQAPYKAYSGSSAPVMGRQSFTPMTYAAEGGIMGLAHGGSAKQPRYLDGATDGMADKINTDIDGHQAAKLSHGEFVIPADVVSHLGNGNSTAGANALYKMMARVRKARTGNPKQGKQINPEKFTPGGVAGYAGGGAVAFAGPTGSAVVDPTVAVPTTGQGTSNSSSLSNWAGPTVTNMIGRADALSNKPYEAYTGPLVAGTSPLQTQAFNTASNLPTTYNATQFNSGLGPVGSIQSYMNPYMQGAVDVQNTEARRQADISRVADNARLTQAGGYGGGRQAIMEAENRRNLGTLQNANQLTGLNTAYDKAVQQQLATANMGMTAQQNTEASKQFGAGYGLSSLGAQETAGDKQRAIEQQGIDASRAQFEEERADPYKKLQFLQTMFSGMPVATNTVTPNTSSASRTEDLLGLLKTLFP